MANKFRQDVEAAVRHLDTPETLTKVRTWYRNGARGNLHATRNCYKSESWSSSKVDLSVVDAAKKRTCTSCCSLAEVVDRTTAQAASKVGDMDRALKAAEGELAKGDALDIGIALGQLERVDETLAVLNDDENDLVARAIADIRQRAVKLKETSNEAAARLRSGAAEWAASAIALRNILRDEHSVTGADPGDYVVFGPNKSERGASFDDILGRIYLRWNRLRSTSKEKADEVALKVLEDAVLERPAQLDFPAAPPDGETNLLEWTKVSWKNELLRRLNERLIPVWERDHVALAEKTGTKLLGIHGDVARDETRSLIAAHPGARRGAARLALVPEVVAIYIGTIEKRWSSDVVEIVDACEPEILDTVLALWDPLARESEFASLSSAVRAASAV